MSDIVEVYGSGTIVEINDDLETIEIVTVGIQGPAGGSGGGLHTHTQASPLTVWTINHNLGRYPSIQSYVGDGVAVYGRLTQVSLNQATIEFNVAQSGYAVCI